MKEQYTPQTELRKVVVGEWETTVGPKVVLSESGMRPFFDRLFASYAASYKPKSGFEYFFYDKTGLPSPIVRVDMPLVTGEVPYGQGFFEIEARPAGLGLDTILFPEHGEIFTEEIKCLQTVLGRKIAVKMFPYERSPKNNPAGEKREFAQRVGIEFFDIDENPDDMDEYYFLTYGNDGDVEELKRYERQSLFPVRDDGDKDYLVQMGVAQTADVVAVSKRLALQSPFVLKPKKGMWAQDVQIYKGSLKIKNIQGFAESEDITDLVESGGLDNYLLQPFRAGFLKLDGEEYCAMARIYAFADIETGLYNATNGLYIARRNVKLHGTSDAVTGELVFGK